MRRFHRLMSAALAAALLTPVAALAVPGTVPVQGVLQDADGLPVAGELPVVFNLYADAAGETLVWTETRQVNFDRGFFTLDLGGEEPLDAGLFRDNPDGLWLGIAVDGDDEMDPVALGTAPFAGFAQYAGEAATAAAADSATTAGAADRATSAETADRATVADTADDAALLGGVPLDGLARADHSHAFAALTDIPAGLADGDDDTTYAAGDGLTLADGSFALRACASGEVLLGSDAGWVCADGATLAPAVGAELVGTELVVTDGAAMSVVDLASLVADADADPANELLIGAALEGATLVLTDAGGARRVDLSVLIPDAALTVNGVSLDGTVLTLTRGADPADALTVDLGGLVPADGDSDPTNELLRGGALDGTVLTLSDAGGDVTVDLGALVLQEVDGDPLNELLQSAALQGTELVLTDAGGQFTVDLGSLVDDADADAANELIRNVAFAGGTLTISDAGGDHTVDLSGLTDDADADPTNELITGAVLGGTVLTLAEGGAQVQVDLAGLVNDADADPANELITGASLDGTVLTLTDAGGQRRIDLASLVNDADANPANELLQGASLDGTVLTLEDAGGQRRIDLASLVDDADANPANELITGFSLNGTTLRIDEGGQSRQVDIGGIGADNQTLGFVGNTGALSIARGNTVNVYQGTFVLSSNLSRSADDIAFPIGINDVDDTTAVAALPFSVTYSGVAYNSVLISSNGWIEFGAGAGDSDLSNDCLPTAVHAGPFIAAYWDDLRSTVRWATEGTAPNRVFAVYYDARLWNDAAQNVDFVVQIHEGSGLINVRYTTVAPGMAGQGATIGFQGAGGAGARAYPLGCNVAIIDDNADDADPNTQSWSVTPLR